MIKGLTLNNRLVMPPMATNIATEEGEVTDRHIRHYSARAEGGVRVNYYRAYLYCRRW
ncbi:hypothetical protein ACFLUQ_00635 [Chloroflexota bacterium]